MKITPKEIKETENRLGICSKTELNECLRYTKADIRHCTKLLKMLEKTVDMAVYQTKHLFSTINFIRKSLDWSKRDLIVLTEIKRNWNKWKPSA